MSALHGEAAEVALDRLRQLHLRVLDASSGADHPALVVFQKGDRTLAEVLLRRAGDFSRKLGGQAFGMGQRAELRGQGIVGRLKVIKFGLQIGERNVGSKLAGEQVSREQSHGDKEKNRDNADEDVGDDQAVTQPPQ